MQIQRFIWAFVIIAWSLSPAFAQQKTEEQKDMKVKKITAVLFAAELEPSVKFWVERMGFHKTIEVPDGGKLAFVALQKDNVELMYQTYKSAEKDAPPAVSRMVRQGPTFLYIDVDNLDETIAAMKGVEVVMPVRTTFYGAKEIGVRDPAGHFVTFAQQGVAHQQ